MLEVEGTIKKIEVYSTQKPLGDSFVKIDEPLRICTTYIELDVGDEKIENFSIPAAIHLERGDYVKILYNKNSKGDITVKEVIKQYYNEIAIRFVIE